MERIEFLKTLGTGAMAVCAGCSLVSCEAESVAPVDIVIDISLPDNASLQAVGGSLIKDQVIVARVTSLEFVAVAKACTHAGTTIAYVHSGSRFNCPNHGSNFSLSGGVQNGPATQPLKQYGTEFTGHILRVFPKP